MPGETPAPKRRPRARRPVVAAVRRDLKEMPDAIAKSALAASALALAAEIDDPENSATSKSMCAKSLYDALDRLSALAPKKKETTPVDELRLLRTRRRTSAS